MTESGHKLTHDADYEAAAAGNKNILKMLLGRGGGVQVECFS